MRQHFSDEMAAALHDIRAALALVPETAYSSDICRCRTTEEEWILKHPLHLHAAVPQTKDSKHSNRAGRILILPVRMTRMIRSFFYLSACEYFIQRICG